MGIPEGVHHRLLSQGMLRPKLVGRLAGVARAQARSLTTPGLAAAAHRHLATSARALAATSPSPNDAFATGTNTYYAEEMYRRWKSDPSSVHASWDAYFSGLDKGVPSSQAFQPPPGLISLPTAADGAPSLHAGTGQDLTDHLKASLTLVSTQKKKLIDDDVGTTPGPCISSTRSSHCRTRSFGCPRCRS